MGGREISSGCAGVKGVCGGCQISGGTLGWFGLCVVARSQSGSLIMLLAKSKIISDAWIHLVGTGEEPTGKEHGYGNAKDDCNAGGCDVACHVDGVVEDAEEAIAVLAGLQLLLHDLVV
eukprot:10269020-Ditylum_brightwellii.AAC.1